MRYVRELKLPKELQGIISIPTWSDAKFDIALMRAIGLEKAADVTIDDVISYAVFIQESLLRPILFPLSMYEKGLPK